MRPPEEVTGLRKHWSAACTGIAARHQPEYASTLITSQLPLDQWHAYLVHRTVADAILDRLVHNAHKVALMGDSMRKRQAVNRKDR